MNCISGQWCGPLNSFVYIDKFLALVLPSLLSIRYVLECGGKHFFSFIFFNCQFLQHTVLAICSDMKAAVIDFFSSFFFLQTRDKLMAENAKLKEQLEASNDQNTLLRSHLGLIRKNTIAFILEQMDALHIQRDTEVQPGRTQHTPTQIHDPPSVFTQ